MIIHPLTNQFCSLCKLKSALQEAGAHYFWGQSFNQIGILLPQRKQLKNFFSQQKVSKYIHVHSKNWIFTVRRSSNIEHGIFSLISNVEYVFLKDFQLQTLAALKPMKLYNQNQKRMEYFIFLLQNIFANCIIACTRTASRRLR